MAGGGFGECPRCAKLSLVSIYMPNGAHAVTSSPCVKVKCANCGFEKYLY